MISKPQKMELLLVRAPNDAPLFSEEYQAELREFSSQAGSSSQTAFAMDSIDAVGGPIGEFIYDNAGKLITALTTICVVWIKARNGRKLKLKIGDLQLEANSEKQMESLVKQAKALLEKKE
jgi:hypothetical protein